MAKNRKPDLLSPGIIDADDYQADKPQWLVDMKAAMTPEEVYERDLAHGGYRNLVMEKDLDLSKIDQELLEKAKVWIDEKGDYHPEVLG